MKVRRGPDGVVTAGYGRSNALPSVILSISHSRNEDEELDLPRCGCGARWQLSGCLSGNCRCVCRGAVGEARSGTCGPVAIGTADGFAHTFPDGLADTRSRIDSNSYLQFNSYDLCLIVRVWVRALAQGSQLWPILSGVARRSIPGGGGQKSKKVGPCGTTITLFRRVFSSMRNFQGAEKVTGRHRKAHTRAARMTARERAWGWIARLWPLQAAGGAALVQMWAGATSFAKAGVFWT